ncbi:MAG TPA: nucleotide disphospho-sugar-binding domain-containing protein [Streptosporangiaceae bacterium]|nr:nucleotide disphospho-sugar-binding domain-containing protein [Streptosporangiaceae bacterium]
MLAAPAMFSGLASAYDVPFVPLELDMSQVGESVAGHHGLRHVVRFCRAMGRRAAARSRPWRPRPVVAPTWWCTTRCSIWPGRLPGLLSTPSYRAARWLSGAWCRKDVDRWRRDVLGLPSRPGRHDPLVSGDGTPVTVLHAFSQHVIPRPADWPATARCGGGCPSDRFLVIGNAPHDWLFPPVDAIVHHGGAGTTAAALHAGKPQVIWPFGVDQPYWARRMEGLGVAPAAQPAHHLTGPSLAAALDRALGDPGLTRRSAALASLLRAEDGAGQAVSHLEGVISGSRVAVGA